MGSSGSLEVRFWRRVGKTPGCWPWGGAEREGRYGRLFVGPRGAVRSLYAHRVSWELHFGPIPNDMQVLHHCDNPPCVRPDHLFLGTQQTNMADMVAKGRHGLTTDPSRAARGENASGHKVSEQSVREIRQLAGLGWTRHRIAILYGLTDVAVGYIVQRKTWQHVA